MQILHFGFHKTASTSLQQHLFAKAARPYYGLHGSPNWLIERAEWFRLFSGDTHTGLDHLRDQPFVFSDESALLRLGGYQAAERVAASLKKLFTDPYLVFSVRNPPNLLVSGYYHSLSLRRNACGVRNFFEPVRPRSPRFDTFKEWWDALREREAISLAGLLRYDALVDIFTQALGRERVLLLPIEWLKRDHDAYVARLLKLGFSEKEARAFVDAPPLNTGDGKELRFVRRGWTPAGRALNRSGLYPAVSSALHGLKLARPAEWIMYSASRTSVRASDAAVIDEMRAFYPEYRV